MKTKYDRSHRFRRWRGVTGAIGLLWLGISTAPAAPVVRTLETFSESPARQVGPYISYQDGKLKAIVYAGPRSYGVHEISLDEIGVQSRQVLSPTTVLGCAYDSQGQLHMARPGNGIQYTIDSAAFPKPQTITIPESQVAYPFGPLTLALDSRDRPMIAFLGYWQQAPGQVGTATFNIASGTWQVEAIAGTSSSATGAPAKLALAFDRQDRPIIAYVSTAGDVVVLTNNGLGWTMRKTSGDKYTSSGLALVCTSEGTPLVAATSSSGGGLVLLRFGSTGPVAEQIRPPGPTYVFGPQSMALDNSGQVHLAYYEQSSTVRTKLAIKTGGTWSFTEIAPVVLRDNYSGPGICFDPNNQWVVSFYNHAAYAAYVAGPGLPQRLEDAYPAAPGRWSECEVGGGPGQPGNSLQAASWDGSTLGTNWELSGLAIATVEETANTVDPDGNGQITYKTTYDISNSNLILDAAVYGGTGLEQVKLDSYTHVTVFTLAAGQIDWNQSYTDLTATGYLSSYPRNSVQLTGRATFDGGESEPPAGYPGCNFVGAILEARWGAVSDLQLEFRYCQEDDDFDRASNCTDNCQGISNPSQSDWDHDGIGDACETSAHMFVNQAAPAGGDGVTWATAYNNLREALAAAGSMSGESTTIRIEIWVAAGVYKPDQGPGATPGDIAAMFVVPARTTLLGGFVGNEDPATFDVSTRNLQANATVLSGDLLGDDQTGGGNSDNTLKIIHCGNAANVLIDGLQITGATGTAEDQGAVFLGIADCTVRHCIIRGNYGPAVRTMAGNTRLENCLIAGNGPSHGCGIVAGGNVDVVGCTVVENSDSTGLAASGGLSVTGPYLANVVDSILWGNVGYIGTNLAAHEGATISIRNSLAQFGMFGVYIDTTATLNWATSVLDSDPLFVANGAWNASIWTAGDYHLADGSPAINAGDNEALNKITRDLDGNPRITGCVADLGVYENSTAGLRPPNAFALDGDCDVDMADFAILAACATGPGVPAPPGCQQADADFDGDIDSVDFAGFQRCYSGDGVLARTHCDR